MVRMARQEKRHARSDTGQGDEVLINEHPVGPDTTDPSLPTGRREGSREDGRVSYRGPRLGTWLAHSTPARYDDDKSKTLAHRRAWGREYAPRWGGGEDQASAGSTGQAHPEGEGCLDCVYAKTTQAQHGKDVSASQFAFGFEEQKTAHVEPERHAQ